MQFLRGGVLEKPIYRGELPKRGGLDSLQIEGGLGKKEAAGVFDGRLIPHCTECCYLVCVPFFI